MLDYNDSEAVKTLFATEGDRIAAVVVEPVMHGPTTGSIDPLPGFLETLRSLCDTHGAVLIFDEILTGFRHALGGGQEMLGVVPDLAAFGKALSNGYPIAALCGRADLLRHLSPSGRAFFSGTYNGNVVSVAAALATIERLGTARCSGTFEPWGNVFVQAWMRYLDPRNVTAHARCRGSMVAIHCSERRLNSFGDVMRHHDMSFSPPLMAHLFEHGVYLKPRKVLRFAISAAHSEADIDRTVELVDDHCAGRGSEARL